MPVPNESTNQKHQMMDQWVVGVDLGGTKIEVGLVDPENRIVDRKRMPTRSLDGPHKVVKRIAQVVDDMAELLPSDKRIAALGICCPGPVDFATGTLVDPPNLPGLHNAPFRSLLSERLSIPVCLEHDAKATALGEFHFGAGRDEESMVFIIIGTGVGAAIIQNGSVLRGKYNTAGEIGHVTLDRDGDICSCGSRGCVETYMAGPGLARRYKHALEKHHGHPISDQIGGEMVSKLAGQGDPIASRILFEAGEALGLAVANMAMLFDIDLFVIGGSVYKAGDLLLEPARRIVPKYTYRSVGSSVHLVTTELCDDGPLLGCAWLARETWAEEHNKTVQRTSASNGGSAQPLPAATTGSLLESPEEIARLEEVEGIVTDIQRFSVHDGPGIRTNVFLKGCPLRCSWCSNPETQRPHPELAFSEQRCMCCGQFADNCGDNWGLGGQTLAAREKYGSRTDRCPTGGISWIGVRRAASDVMADVLRDRPFYGDKGGMTLTGGEPAFQPRMAEALLRLARYHGVHTAMETTGHTRWNVLSRLVPHLNTILFDVKHMDPQIHKTYTGTDNTLILVNLTKLATQSAPVEVRVPLIPGFNADEESVTAIADFILAQDGLSKSVTLLPYHTYGQSKYASLGREYPWEGQPLLNEDQINALADITKLRGLKVTVGG